MLPFQFDLLRPGTLIKRKEETVNDYYVVTCHYGIYVVAVRATNLHDVDVVEVREPLDWDICHVRGVSQEARHITRTVQ